VIYSLIIAHMHIVKKGNSIMQKNEILIVDDETFNLDLLEFSLEELSNINIIRALDAKLALDILDKHSIDLIILDISMPGMDGLEMLKVLKLNEDTKFIPVIMVTAKNEERHNALEYGSEDFLAKPIDVIELKFKVNNLLKLKKFNDLQQYFNQRLEEEIEKKKDELKKFALVEQELSMAKDIQQRLLPKTYPQSANLDIFGSCTQAHDIGGDYYDAFETKCKNYTIFIMADVSGHGLASALIAMQFRTLVHAHLYDSIENLSTIVQTINTIFTIDNNESSMFITALFLRLNHQTRMIESVNAGHHNPLGSINITHTSGIPIGIMEDANYTVSKTIFEKGNTLILFTDGILEEENNDAQMYEKYFYENYEQVKHLSSKEQISILLKNFYAYIVKQNDDVTLLAICG